MAHLERDRPSLLVALAMGLLGCTSTSLGGGAGVDAGPPAAEDAGPAGEDAGEPGQDAGTMVAEGVPRAEHCGDALDNDDDGEIDEGCACDREESRPCWLGPPDTRMVGACRDGVQSCDAGEGEFRSWGACMDAVIPTREIVDNGVDDDCDGETDEPDGICVPAGAEVCGNDRDDDCDTLRDCDDPECIGTAGCPAECQPSEVLCHGGHDDDCDGSVDCDDAECFGDPVCIPGPCPAGQTPTYRQRDLGASYGASSIREGDGAPVMPMTCEEMRCPAGQVAVQTTSGGGFACVPPPPECPAGLNPTYVSAGTWRCDPPCEYIIHYGSIYDGRNVCAGRPDVSCPSGQVPTFVYETETWQCRTTCNNGLYDRLYIGSMLVCVPC